MMKPMKIFFFFPLAVLLFMTAADSGAFTQTAAPAKGTDNECQNAATTSAMRACENARYEGAQRELGVAYQTLLQRLDGEQKQKLGLAQQAWMRFRDTNAEFQASLAQGGTLAPLIKMATLTEMTRARTSELKKSTLP
jgi:uncharacterized protein YecT (DUF1311 family)